MYGEEAACGRLQGYLADGGGKGREELLGELGASVESVGCADGRAIVEGGR